MEDSVMLRGKYLPLQNVPCIGNSSGYHTELNPEYSKFMESYRKSHCKCPKCGSKRHSSTMVGYLFDRVHPERYKDRNKVICSNCGWVGIAHDLLAES